MSNEVRRRSPAEWFLESFFQERNIKWMLALGVLTVFGSSLMLVTRQWDQWAPLWKALAVIGYSGAVFGCGELAFCRLGLRNTGTVMRALSLLLWPLSFLAINRLGMTSLPMQVGLLVLDAALTSLAARRIFSEFLRGSQPTLVASYVALALAGGVLTPLTEIAAPIVALVLWSVFSVGTVKSARQVFWLAEEHKRPRVCGFLPMLLLGSQFLTLFVLNCATEFTLPWLGLGLVLVAVPVLLTTDAIARVFHQRTGNLVRPLPWTIVLPLFVGLVLCFTGVGFAAIPQADRILFSMALTPAAGLAAAMMFVAARRTSHAAFVWAGLIGAAISYQAMPAYFAETARLVVGSAASAVHEQRLPVAFYGLTWMPLIFGSTFFAVRAGRRGDVLIEVPYRRFAIGVAVLLFAISFTHAKAIFPVAAAMTLTFGVQSVVFGDRRLKLLAALAWTALTASSQFFAASVAGWSTNADVHRLVMLAGAAMLLVRSSVVPQLRFPLRSQRFESALAENEFAAEEHSALEEQSASERQATRVAEQLVYVDATHNVSLIHTVVIGAMWLVAAQPAMLMSLATAGGFAAAGLLLAHAWLRLKPGLGELALAGFLAVVVKSTALVVQMNAGLLLTCTVPALVMWLGGQPLTRRTNRFAWAFGRPSLRVSGVALTLLAGASQLALLVTNIGLTPVSPNSWLLVLPTLMTTMWLFDVARRSSRSRSQREIRGARFHRAEQVENLLHERPGDAWRMTFAAYGCIAVVMTSGSVLIGAGNGLWIPTVWAGMAFAAVTVLSTRYRGETITMPGPIVTPVRVIATAALVLISAGTLLIEPFAGLARLAGLIATSGLLIDSLLRRDRGQRDSSLMLGQWQIAMLVAHLVAPSLRTLSDLFSGAALPAALPVAITVAAGFTALRLWRDSHRELEVSGVHNALSVAAFSYALLASAATPMSVVEPVSAVLAVVTFAILAIGEFTLAVRRQRIGGVWMGQGIVAAAIAWLLVAGVISIGHGFAMFAFTTGAVIELAISNRCERSPRLAFAAEAFRLPAHVLPLIAVAIGIGRHVTGAPDAWLGTNSLALLMSAAFYFWQGIESNEESESESRRGRFVLSSVILNVALGLLWRELQFSDPQFFMIPAGLTVLWLVEILKCEIPETFRDPLRYAGALMILVSPTFHIVGGSWLHLMSLMVCSVIVSLLAIGLRLRALLYSGTAFLVADLVAMVIRGSIDHPNLLWLAGLAVGASVITLGAICENHRERLLTRLRTLAAELQSWQ